ncbi:MAG TPA: Gfo/Idh/MocA family oxidoreductase [bacterium]|nr:Gfo/Idh/MocA family oxidoreductase [bacterium]HQL61996.1 Gfo/Idh/MocA family oxidoreductase [bacterium]
MSPEQQTNRRSFMKRTTMGTAGISLTLAAGPFPGKVLGANDKIAVGLIGCGDQGCYDLKSMMKTGEIVVSGLCDVSVSQREKAADLAGEYAMENPIRSYKDFRELLECPKTDAVIIATPDHWHALPMVMACQAGKDVYVEKPLALTIYEGRKMVKAARKYDRVVQTGTQQRSGSHFQKAVELVRSGRIGKVSYVRTFNYDNSHPEGIGNPADCDPPADLDWDFWLGPAPKRPYNPNRCFGTFRWFFDYSGGKITDWGTHLIDIVHWAMRSEWPKSASAAGGKFYLEDNRETPDTLTVTYEFDSPQGPFILEYQNRDCNSNPISGYGYGIIFYGTDGTLFLDRGGYELVPETRKRDRNEKPVDRTQPEKSDTSDQHFPHVKNFLECMRTRKRTISDVEITHRSTSTPHLGNISLHVGHKIEWDGENEKIIGDREASKLLKPKYRKPWKISMLDA